MTTQRWSTLAIAAGLAACGSSSEPGSLAQTEPLSTGPAPNCEATVKNLMTGGDAVAHAARVHFIYWLPSDVHFTSAGTDADDLRYEQLLEQFVGDLGSTPFFQILTQYSDAAGPVSSVSLAGKTRYTAAYPNGAGTVANPLRDADVEGAIKAVLTGSAGAGWTVSTDDLYFVFTGAGVQSCSSTDFSSCSFPTAAYPEPYHGYHSFYMRNGAPVVYALLPAAATLGFQLPMAVSPNGASVDATIVNFAHELFESITDPTFNSWQGPSGRCDEIADKCNDTYDALQSDGSNLILPNGHRYVVADEWSNAASSCTMNLPPNCSVSEVCPPTYGPPVQTVTCNDTMQFYLYDSYTGSLSPFPDTATSYSRPTETFPYHSIVACPANETTGAWTYTCARFSTYEPQTTWCGAYTKPVCPRGTHWCGADEGCLADCY